MWFWDVKVTMATEVFYDGHSTRSFKKAVKPTVDFWDEQNIIMIFVNFRFFSQKVGRRPTFCEKNRFSL